MELRQLRYFMAVVEAGSFTAAAVTLRMSQPPLSLAIAKLERELGVKLLARSARGVRATSAGMYLLEAGSRILSEVDDATTYLARYGGGTAGSVTIAAVPVLMWHRIPAFLRHDALQYATLDLRLVDPPPWTAIDLVVDRKVDLAFIVVADAERLAEQYAGILRVVPWGEIDLVAVFPPEYDHLPDPVDLSVFNDQVFVLPRRTLAVASLPEVVAEALSSNGVVPSVIRTVETIQTSIPLVEAGMAMSILPNADGKSLDNTKLVVRRIKQSIPTMTAVAIFRLDLAASPALGGLISRVVEYRPNDGELDDTHDRPQPERSRATKAKPAT